MSAAAERPGRFVMAPVVEGVATWHLGTDLLLTPIRLATPVAVVLPAPLRAVSGR